MRVSKRTIYRDIRLLQDVGLDIFLDPTNRAYALRSRFPKPIRNWLRAGITAGVVVFREAGAPVARADGAVRKRRTI